MRDGLEGAVFVGRGLSGVAGKGRLAPEDDDRLPLLTTVVVVVVVLLLLLVVVPV